MIAPPNADGGYEPTHTRCRPARLHSSSNLSSPVNALAISRDVYSRIVSRELHALQTDKLLKNSSVYDLIDTCRAIYELAVHELDADNSRRGPYISKRALELYIKGYVVFNYFINNFVMMHFKGFDVFIESSENDFYLYLDLFGLYNKDLLSPGSALLKPARDATLLYLAERGLLNYDSAELHTWLWEWTAWIESSITNAAHLHSGGDAALLHFETNSFESRDNLSQVMDRFPSLRGFELTHALTTGNRNGFYAGPERSLPTPHSLSQSDSIDSGYPSAQTLMEEAPIQTSYSAPSTAQNSAPRLPAFPPPPPPVPTRSAVDTKHRPIKNRSPEYDSLDSSQTSQNYYTPINEASYSAQSMPLHYPQTLPPTASKSLAPYNYSSSQPSLGKPALPSRDAQPYPVREIEHTSPYNGPTYATTSTPEIPYYQRDNLHNHQIDNLHNRLLQRSAPQPPASPYPPMQAVCGLHNFGATCYINLTIQLLFAIPNFQIIFNNSSFSLKSERLLNNAVHNLLRTFNQNSGKSVTPSKFVRVASNLKPDFRIPTEQQDAQEFLLFVLQRMHEEMSSKGNGAPCSAIGYAAHNWHLNISSKDSENYFKWCQLVDEAEGVSPVNDMLQGHLQNKLACNKCGCESISYSPFTILSLPIPSHRNQHNAVDLRACLEYYTQDEILSGGNAWNCPKCHKQPHDVSLDAHPVFAPKKLGIFRLGGRKSKLPPASKGSKGKSGDSSTKSLRFVKLPPILFIHLARFSSSLVEKLDVLIEYPYQLHMAGGSNAQYVLTGIINHYGNLKGGHYTATANKAIGWQHWFVFDDEICRPNVAPGNPTSYGTFLSKDAYVLCYARI